MRNFLILLSFLSSSAVAEEISKEYIRESILKAAKDTDVPAPLLFSVCYAESNHRPDAYVHGDGTGNNHAFGICQVLYKTALGLGMLPDDRCLGDFRGNVERSHKTCRLFGPYTNAYYAALYLKQKLDQYNYSWISAIAAYNTGTLRTCKTGVVTRAKDKKVIAKCQIGGLLNQKYVDRVLGYMGKFFEASEAVIPKEKNNDKPAKPRKPGNRVDPTSAMARVASSCIYGWRHSNIHVMATGISQSVSSECN